MVFGLDWQAWVTLAIVAGMLVALIREIARPEMIFLAALGLLLGCGILTPEEAFQGFSNPAVLTVGALFVVAVGVQNTGAIAFADRLLFSRTTSLPAVLARLMLTTASMSAFLNNTPIVAMLIPRLQAWADTNHVPSSKLLIPLSYAAIIGGMTTLIGTSTNLLVSGLMQSYGYDGLGLFDLTWVGLPAALAVIAYVALVGHRLLPLRSQGGSIFDEQLDQYLFDVRVGSKCFMVGQTIERAELRSLGEAYLVHLYRDNTLVPSSPETVLHSGDVLTFLGKVTLMDKLLERPGLERVVAAVHTKPSVTLPLYEAVVAPSSQLVGRTLKEANFREQFQGVVLGIHRRDTQIEGPLSQVKIRPGDLLLIEAPKGFDERWNSRRSEFYLVAPRRPALSKPDPGKAPLALLILLAIVVLAALDVAPIATTAFVGAMIMLATGCVPGWEARRAVDFPVLVVIASALGVGQALEQTGIAGVVASGLVNAAAPLGTIGVLAAVYLMTSLLTEVITNNAAAALMLGIGLAAAKNLGAAPEAFAIAVTIAASASFLTPIGYQTNLMVMAAGGYRFTDYTRIGLPAALLTAVVSITMIGLLWL